MSTITHSDVNRFQRLKEKVQFIKADLHFLKRCSTKKVFPKFINIKCKNNKNYVDKVIFKAKMGLLKGEISFLYKKLADTEIELYSLHLRLAKYYNNLDDWLNFEREVYEINVHKMMKKHKTLHKKFMDIMRSSGNRRMIKNGIRLPVMYLDNVVRNETNIQFTAAELELLNKGLNYSTRPEKPPITDLIVDIEVAIKKLPNCDKENVRVTCDRILKNDLILDKRKRNKKSCDENKTVKLLNERNCFLMKADKGNAIVILTKEDYNQRISELIENGPYKTCTKVNPLNNMVSDVKTTVLSIFGSHNCFKDEDLGINKFQLYVSNPTVPKLYGLPKIHKPGKAVRPIVSCINSPVENIAKFLVRKFKELQPPRSFSIKNSFQFVEKLKNLSIMEDEIMVSFDVTSLFPSLPRGETLDLMMNWIDSQPNLTPAYKEKLIKLTQVCVKNIFFSFQNKVYEQTEGSPMGLSLSPLFAEVYMGNLEDKIMNGLVNKPRIWIRYVDDIFVIAKRVEVADLFQYINSLNNHIKFTMEEENNGRLSFLDVLVMRNNHHNSLTFKIYRKPTQTERFITYDSFQSFNSKFAAFNSMFHRLFNIPMREEDFIEEKNYIFRIGRINGFNQVDLKRIFNRHQRKNRIKTNTTLIADSSSNNRVVNRASMTFYPPLTNKIKKVFKEHDIELVFNSVNKIKNRLDSTKDKTDKMTKAGIYKIDCNTPGCNAVYIGQSSRSISQRLKEHMRAKEKKKTTLSSVAEHMVENDHTFSPDNLSMLKCVSDNRKLDVLESLFLHKFKNTNVLMNSDLGNCTSILLNKKYDC